MKVLALFAGAALLALAAAECPNACSGHGMCAALTDHCDCDRSWRGNDCSQRTCPFGLSWTDSGNGDLNSDGSTGGSVSFVTNVGGASATFRLWESHPSNLWGVRDDATYGIASGKVVDGAESFGVYAEEAHFFAECSDSGICNRETGVCQCFPGFEGADCGRSACPNDCSGHGRCRYLAEVTPADSTNWDGFKNQICVCDPGFEGPDCGKRQCRKGDDPLLGIASDLSQIQSVTITCTANLTGTFRLTFTDAFGEALPTRQVEVGAAASVVQAALLAVPNDALPSVTVTRSTPTDTEVVYSVEFTGVAGNAADLGATFSDATCSAAVAQTRAATSTSTVCSSRGLCDSSTGLCVCARGYTGVACSEQNTLAGRS